MTRVKKIEKYIEELGPDELSELRRWFAEYDSDQWDEQIESDAKEGRLDSIAREALGEYRRGETPAAPVAPLQTH